ISARAKQQRHNHQEKVGKAISSHIPPSPSLRSFRKRLPGFALGGWYANESEDRSNLRKAAAMNKNPARDARSEWSRRFVRKSLPTYAPFHSASERQRAHMPADAATAHFETPTASAAREQYLQR